MAHTKAGGSTKLGRDSRAKYLGIKKNDGQSVKTGELIVKQRGTHYHPGKNVKKGGDDCLYSLTTGKVVFKDQTKIKYDGNRKKIKVVSVENSK
ncbi:MAG TPA: 50S ribosomal protein L27 [Candidatus Paceibacterota bacterium]|nr:50S ribosomal protein L27 [Candidatus Paceibacterota bacterium]